MNEDADVPTITIGPASDPAVTHQLPQQILRLFDISYSTFRSWKDTHGFPRAVLAGGGGCFYSRAQIEAWRCSRSAPQWVRKQTKKPDPTPLSIRLPSARAEQAFSNAAA